MKWDENTNTKQLKKYDMENAGCEEREHRGWDWRQEGAEDQMLLKNRFGGSS